MLLVALQVAQRLMDTGARVPVQTAVSGGSSSGRSQRSSDTDPALVLPGLLAPPQLLTRSGTKKPPVF